MAKRESIGGVKLRNKSEMKNVGERSENVKCSPRAREESEKRA